MTHELLFAGFGGQGIMFLGKLAANTGLIQGQHVSWMPSYGPEMRGGTANCHVMISDEAVGSPIVVNPTGLVVMNIPAFDKFEQSTAPGGVIIIDSSLINKKSDRTDVTQYLVPATKMADDMGLKGLANMIIFGKLLKATGMSDLETVKKTVEQTIPASKIQLIEKNMKAIKTGYNYSA